MSPSSTGEIPSAKSHSIYARPPLTPNFTPFQHHIYPADNTSVFEAATTISAEGSSYFSKAPERLLEAAVADVWSRFSGGDLLQRIKKRFASQLKLAVAKKPAYFFFLLVLCFLEEAAVSLYFGLMKPPLFKASLATPDIIFHLSEPSGTPPYHRDTTTTTF